jgi:hypothetical protein
MKRLQSPKIKIKQLQDVISNPAIDSSSGSISGGPGGSALAAIFDTNTAKAQLRLYSDILKELEHQQDLYKQTVQTNEAEVTHAEEQEGKKQERELEKRLTIWRKIFGAGGDIAKAHAEMNKEVTKTTEQQTNLIIRDFNEELKAKQEALREETRAAHQAAQEQIQLRQAEENIELSSIQQQKDNIDTLTQLHVINARQRLQLLRQNAEAEFQIHLKSLQDHIALEAQDPESNPAKIAKLHKDIEKLKREHEREMNQLTNQSVLQQKSRFDSYFHAVSDGFKTQLNGVLQGTQTIGEALRNLWQGIILSIIEKFVDMGLQWAATHLFMHFITKASGVSQIASAAAQAGANAYAATAIIPVVGPELAPAAAATAYAGAISFEGLNTFARGGIVPSDSLAFVHKNEMVLPASISQRLMKGTGSGEVHVHHHGSTVNAIDSRGVVDALEADQTSLIKFIRRLKRDGLL